MKYTHPTYYTQAHQGEAHPTVFLTQQKISSVENSKKPARDRKRFLVDKHMLRKKISKIRNELIINKLTMLGRCNSSTIELANNRDTSIVRTAGRAS